MPGAKTETPGCVHPINLAMKNSLKPSCGNRTAVVPCNLYEKELNVFNKPPLDKGRFLG
jgi:hypothetical protein